MLATWREKAFLVGLVEFHAAEYVCARIWRREEAGAGALLLSKRYTLFMLLGCIEHLAERAFLPGGREHKRSFAATCISAVGLAMLALGAALRVLSQATAKGDFSHHLDRFRARRGREKRLVQHGIYRCCRHPSYAGFELWAIGGQVLLVNPIATVVFAVACREFFSERVHQEEAELERLFGAEWRSYKARTPAFLPSCSQLPSLRTSATR